MTEEAKTPTPSKTTRDVPFASEISSLKSIEKSLDAAFVAYTKVKRERAEGHPPHAAHNAHGDVVGRAIGKAHGGLVMAIEALEAVAGFEERASSSHADAEAAKKAKEQAK